MQTSIPNHSRYQRFRSRRKAQGMKELRLWVPDPSVSGFKEEAHRQSRLASEATDDQETLEFINDSVRSIEGWE